MQKELIKKTTNFDVWCDTVKHQCTSNNALPDVSFDVWQCHTRYQNLLYVCFICRQIRCWTLQKLTSRNVEPYRPWR